MRLLWSLWFLFHGVGFLHMLLLHGYRLYFTSGLLMLFLHYAMSLVSGMRQSEKQTIHGQMLPTSICSFQSGSSSCFSFQRFHIFIWHIMIIFTLFPSPHPTPNNLFFSTKPLLLSCVFSYDHWISLELLQEHGREAIYQSMSNLSVVTSLKKSNLLLPGNY